MQRLQTERHKKSHSAYDMKHDRDKDGWACE
ncbi:excalibur calcium-binding domain-containing protein [Domibacillus sp. A3M-37]